MSLALILFGAALVSLALFNKVPRYVPAGRLPARRRGSAARSRAVAARGGTTARPRPAAGAVGTRARVELASARLTEQGRALCTAVGGSALIVAFFLTLSGL
ncbi:hypothetical protein BJF83_13795 [Nocardiopsis sp. CNR-923]|uniref:hypothetical protein n=1 Tax=Nocardiopsis sp. CNR-923 TaxID=1904965 RepID=UPI00095FE059|nr:hypothetical protein [Nocardiopsis sp. CNR-923]OLT28855.1 hypothetical protein BJF83_13795 [Nocardiopsis sp. CNR-923]